MTLAAKRKSYKYLLTTYRRREPEIIPCACGCGGTLDRWHRNGRERCYLRGHYANVQWRGYEEWRDREYGAIE